MSVTEQQQSLFDQNLALAQEVRPQIVQLLRGASLDDNLQSVELDNGQVGLTYQGQFVTSRQSPVDYAKKIIEAQYEQELETLNKYTFGVLFICDPYVLSEVFSQFDWFRHIYSIFPSADYLFTLFHFYDFEVLLRNEAFKPLAFNDTSVLETNIGLILGDSDYLTNGLKILAYHPFERFANDVLRQIMKVIKEITLNRQANWGTSVLFGGDILINELRNLAKFVDYPDISCLSEKLKGKPIVCIAAGPSLKKNIEYLASIQDKVYIIAVSAVLKPLIDHGIIPDLVTTLDMHPEIMKYLDDVETKDLRIVTEMSGYFGVMDNYPANYIISVASSMFKSYADDYIRSLNIEIPRHTKVSGAMTVAFMSIQIAQKMGASEIILLGQDLAFEGATHIDGSSYKSGFNIFTQNGKEYFHFDSLGGKDNVVLPVDRVKGYYGKDVPTTTQFMAYIQFLAMMIKGRDINVINATEGGAYLDGCEHISLKEVYTNYIEPNSIDSKDIGLPKRRDYDFTQLNSSLDNLESKIERYETVVGICQETLDNIEEYNCLEKEKETPKIITKMDVAADKANKNVSILLNDYKNEIDYIAQNNPGGYYLFKKLQNVNDQEYSPRDQIVDMKNKAVLLCSSVQEGLDVFIRELKSTVKEIKEKHHSDLQ